MRARLGHVVAVVLMIAGCSGSSDSPAAGPSVDPCPIEDSPACARLAEGIAALTDRDAAAVLARRSRRPSIAQPPRPTSFPPAGRGRC
jgi:hypothetical protein